MAIWLNLFDYIDISWWFLVPALIIVFLMGILELILIFKEIKSSMKDKKAKNKKYN
nr:MAG TPA: Rifin [Caudoviricetes sp.]